MRWQPVRAAARRRAFGLAAFGIVLVQVVIYVGCVDGTTPDCSDAATQCGPDIDATAERVEAALPEASPPSDAPNDTSSTADAGADGDADLDAGDEG